MPTTISLSTRDKEILTGLTQKVRLFSLRQIAEHWWNDEIANTRRRLRSMVQAELVLKMTVAARSLPSISQPLAVWQPGQEAPNCGQVSYRLQTRWMQRATRSITVFIATAHAAQLFGGIGRGELKNPLQATHDLGVAAVWMQLHTEAPEWAEAWRGEDLMAHTRHGEKLPDAFIVNDSGETTWVIEFGGAYDTPRVEAFHADCVEREVPYQIW